MNPINLLLPDGRPSKVWACGECKLTCKDEAQARLCCTPIPCRFCKQPTEKKYRHGHETATHDACEQMERAQRDAERMERATKLETWDGWVYEWGGGGSNNGYYESVEAYVDHLVEYDGLEPEDWPEWVYVAEPRPGVDLDLGTILESAYSDGYDDMDDDLKGTKELEAAIKAFNEANKGVLVYGADCKRAVRVPKPSEANPCH